MYTAASLRNRVLPDHAGPCQFLGDGGPQPLAQDSQKQGSQACKSYSIASRMIMFKLKGVVLRVCPNIFCQTQAKNLFEVPEEGPASANMVPGLLFKAHIECSQ